MKRVLSLILALALLLPVLSLAELDEDDFSSEELVEDVDLDEDYEFDEEGNMVLKDDESGESFDLTGVSEEDIEKLASQYELDDSIDPKELEINENLPDNIINILLIGLDVKGTKKEKKLTEQGKYAKRSDVLIILSLNTSDGSIKLSSIARNTFVEVPGRKMWCQTLLGGKITQTCKSQPSHLWFPTSDALSVWLGKFACLLTSQQPSHIPRTLVKLLYFILNPTHLLSTNNLAPIDRELEVKRW